MVADRPGLTTLWKLFEKASAKLWLDHPVGSSQVHRPSGTTPYLSTIFEVYEMFFMSAEYLRFRSALNTTLRRGSIHASFE